MPKTSWPVRTLGEICDLVGGGTPSKDRPEFYGGDIPWATVRDLNVEILRTTEHSITREAVKSSSSNIIPAGSVVIATRVGLAVIVAQDTAINQDLRGLVVKNPHEVLADYLFWWYLSAVHLVVAAGTGATVQGVKLPFISGLTIPVPPLEEQKRIVAMLDAASVRVTELTLCYEQARTHANNLFSSALRDALEGNPDWPIKTLGDICEVFDDGDWIESKDQSTSGVRLIQTGNVGDGEFKDRADKARFISETTFSHLRCTEIFPGDLLASRLPDPVGRACLIPETGSKMITAVDCTIMRPSKDIMLPQFLVSSTQTNRYRAQVRAKITGTTRDRISRSNLAEVQIRVPPLEEQKRIVARLDSMRAKTSEMVAAFDAKLVAAKNLRQSILEAAFAGEL